MEKVLVVKSIDELRAKLKKYNGKTVGLVPTMGYLHKGHASLVEKAREENDIVVVSVFVNPIQFGPNEDLETYPRDLDRDIEIVSSSGGDIVFAPSVEEMYPEKAEVFVDLESEIGEKLCGESRPGHFRGVMTVVSKLFNIVGADRAYFGQKDAQQVTIIEKMVRELNFPVKIVRCPILRESDGLAMSSRNVYLSAQERSEATVLYKSILRVQREFEGGEHRVEKLKETALEEIGKSPIAEVEYVEILDSRTLGDIDRVDGPALMALAVRFGKTRLIDNCLLEV